MKKAIVNEASAYFNSNWQRYQLSVKRNMLYHEEMFSTLSHLLKRNFLSKAFSLVDLGCGDSASIALVLAGTTIKKYIGVDEAGDVLKLSEKNLANINCEKEYHAEDMLKALKALSDPADIIFTSYAVHHLSFDQKREFISRCKEKLSDHGILIMIDGVLAKGQTRNDWLDALQARFKTVIPEMTADELEDRMKHPRSNDFPEPISHFETISKEQGWKEFNVLVDKTIFAFMVFAK